MTDMLDILNKIHDLQIESNNRIGSIEKEVAVLATKFDGVSRHLATCPIGEMQKDIELNSSQLLEIKTQKGMLRTLGIVLMSLITAGGGSIGIYGSCKSAANAKVQHERVLENK
jgi:hypothetical protein